MENASKALIIAGAILLAIVIISLGLIVVNNSRGAVDSANVSEQEIQAFNSKWTPYQGSNISKTRVKTLIDTVEVSNHVNDHDVTFKYKVKGTSTTLETKTIEEMKACIKTGTQTYNIELEYNAKTSLVEYIDVSEV